MSLKNICIEVRQQLHCINVFLQFEESLALTENTLRINVKPTELCLHNNMEDVIILLEQYFNLDANSLSGLVVEQQNASFRLSVDNIKNIVTKSKPINTVPELNAQLNNESEAIVALVCGNCKCVLNKRADGSLQRFTRYREFPDSGVDLGELFCHNAPHFDDVLVPNATDFFYGYGFLVLNLELLKTTIREKAQQLYCARCLQHLGETILNQRAAKLWTDALKVCEQSSTQQTDFQTIYTNKQNIKATTSFLHKVILDSRLPEEHIWLSQIMANVKVHITTTMSDRTEHHLLLHILQQQLPVLRNVVLHPLVLEANLSFKLLYKYVAAEEQTIKNKCLLDAWKSDISIQSLQISPKLFISLLEELQRNSLLLPETYRFANDDGFELCYIFY